MKFTRTGIVASIDRLQKDYIFLSVRLNDKPRFKPGQFMMIQLSDSCDPLLLRPFSILRKHNDIYEFLIKIVGRGTKAAAGFQVGRKLLLAGPFGNGFPGGKLSHAVIVVGGAGIASVFAFTRQLNKRGITCDLLYGARNSDELVLLRLLESFNPTVSTEDGSAGYRGKITEFLKDKIKNKSTIFSCGPIPMLASVKDIAAQTKVKCYVSLEARMACGFGVCHGCAVFDVHGKTLRVCKDGPVFDAMEVSFG